VIRLYYGSVAEHRDHDHRDGTDGVPGVRAVSGLAGSRASRQQSATGYSWTDPWGLGALLLDGLLVRLAAFTLRRTARATPSQPG
jgi:hypothetical protein